MAETRVPACRSGALSREENARRRALFEEILSSVISSSVSDRRLRLAVRTSRDALLAVAELISLESRCCPFLDFELVVPSASSSFSVVVSGPEGTASLIEKELGALPGTGSGPGLP